MKTQLPYLLMAIGTAAAVFFALPTLSPAQATIEDPALLALLADVVAQHATLQENATKIDEKLAIIAEDVRQARLFAARGGAHK